MVLPHGKNVTVSGTADPNKEVTVTFGSSSLKTKADSKGKWSVTLPPMQPSAEGQTLTATQNGDCLLYTSCQLCLGNALLQTGLHKLGYDFLPLTQFLHTLTSLLQC